MLGAVGVGGARRRDKTACLDGEVGDDSDAAALVDGLDNRGLRAGHGSQTASPARTGQDDPSAAEGGVPVSPRETPAQDDEQSARLTQTSLPHFVQSGTQAAAARSAGARRKR